MDNQKIDELLEQMHQEIKKTESVDEKGEELLHDLSEDIRNLLERTEELRLADSILQRIEQTIEHFEVTHPDLTAALSNLSAILSNAGI
jgi:predicted AAA+ superfamily ATPase